jgi:hypothetical protein
MTAWEKSRELAAGRPVVCLASGPSLTESDVQLVKAWRDAGQCSVIAVNTTYQMAPWSDAVFAIDRGWWRVHQKAVAELPGTKYAPISVIVPDCVVSLARQNFPRVGNSGAGALVLASMLGASRIVMLGYDCQFNRGVTHWHGNHPRPLGNARSIDKWPGQFNAARQWIKAPVVNCSRKTALTMFKTMKLEEALSDRSSACPLTL